MLLSASSAMVGCPVKIIPFSLITNSITSCGFLISIPARSTLISSSWEIDSFPPVFSSIIKSRRLRMNSAISGFNTISRSDLHMDAMSLCSSVVLKRASMREIVKRCSSEKSFLMKTNADFEKPSNTKSSTSSFTTKPINLRITATRSPVFLNSAP